MLKAYIAGPLRGDGTEYAITQNRARAASVARDLWRAGFSVFCPHLNTAGMVGLLGKEGEAAFIAGDVLWLQHADLLFMLNGWEQSEGARCEHEYATAFFTAIQLLYETETEAGLPIWSYRNHLYDIRGLQAVWKVSPLHEMVLE